MAVDGFGLYLSLHSSELGEDELDGVTSNVQEVIDAIPAYYPAAVVLREHEGLADDEPDTLVAEVFKDRFSFLSYARLIKEVLREETCSDHETRLNVLAGNVGSVRCPNVAGVAVIEDAFDSNWHGIRPTSRADS